MEKLQQALAKARQQRDGVTLRVNTPQQATQLSGDDALWADLQEFNPPAELLEKQRIVTTVPGPNSAAFDILRTKAMLMMRKNGWRRMAVTSPTAGCGKTTTACNLALGMSRNPDLRVILMEFDLRRPQIAARLKMPGRAPIADMLTGKASFADQAVRFRDNVAICAADGPVPDPSSILLSKLTQQTLADIEEIYAPDLMIFDIPPLLISDDSHGLLKDVDCALIVARAEYSTVAQIDACEATIAEQNNVLGVVLNQCRFMEDTGSQRVGDY